ncbi:hypothetical protein MRB53_023694 [Persea americana]|uniref:Uncharacterized protein n=1 Tax=Persea americana TaxID=3435 RepID=A0ACC2LA50_PERAE|nr:hypothetical protein MRB53_023694 [Persea americana]
MGQLFNSSLQTFNVPKQDVQIIPDIEMVTDGIKYCFSDGIGKISLSFARQVAQKCGLNKIPSAFQIRYGGYKGVVAIDRTSFWKLSLCRNENFELIQGEEMRLLDGMLTNRDMALNVLEGMTAGSTKADLAQMLLQGYEPNEEPYLSMSLSSS